MLKTTEGFLSLSVVFFLLEVVVVEVVAGLFEFTQLHKVVTHLSRFRRLVILTDQIPFEDRMVIDATSVASFFQHLLRFFETFRRGSAVFHTLGDVAIDPISAFDLKGFTVTLDHAITPNFPLIRAIGRETTRVKLRLHRARLLDHRDGIDLAILLVNFVRGHVRVKVAIDVTERFLHLSNLHRRGFPRRGFPFPPNSSYNTGKMKICQIGINHNPIGINPNLP